MANQENFQVNLGGVIRLLSDHLYSGPEVYIRELLQNAVDAITARQLVDPSFEGEIKVELVGGDAHPTIMVEDNGIGLDEVEVHQFLATIGQSSKSGKFARDDFIGQFGIGLLSGFVVSDEITVITKSIKEQAAAVEWKGRVDGTYTVRQLDAEFEAGTRVYLRAKPDREELFQQHRVTQLLRHYGQHLPHPITVLAGERSTLVNEDAPWQMKGEGDQEWKENCLAYGQRVFEIDFLDAIPIQSNSGQVQGVAYVLPFSASTSSKQTHRVYLKNMLLAESVHGLLPDWAFFVRCVINADKLRPNAARDSFYQDHVLDAARKELGAALRGYLLNLAKFNPAQLRHLIHLHYLPIKALAIDDDEFFRLFIDWLPFKTSFGEVTLGEYFRENSTIRYVPTVDQFRQIAGVASSQNLCIFNGGYAYDSDLLEKLAVEFPNRNVEHIDSSDLVQDFQELTLDESQAVFDLVQLADQVLQKYKCNVEVRKFEPADLPTLYTANDSASFMRSVRQSKDQADELWSGILDNVEKGSANFAYSQLVLNYRCPLIKRLVVINNAHLLSRIVEILYVQALLLGHYPLANSERQILGDGLLDLIDLFVSGDQD